VVLWCDVWNLVRDTRRAKEIMTWTSEELKRLDRTVLIIRKDGEVRGSLTLETVDERELWLRAIQTLNGTLTK
jgi:hypothetical protein